MTQYLPPNLLALFAARDPLQYLPPADKLPHEKKRVPYKGVSLFLEGFEDPKDTPPPTRVETRDERKERKRKERQEQHAYKLEQDLALWDPAGNPSSTMDPFKTLFVARINFDTSESKLRREFEVYGAVKKICLINDRNSGKPRGYAFIEYEHERDMHSAYKHADGKKIDGRRVLVDVERGRTVKGWRPRRLGGGLGGTRKGGPDENTRFSGRDEFGTGSERGGTHAMAVIVIAREYSLIISFMNLCNLSDRFRGGAEEERGVGGGGGSVGAGRRVERSRSRERRRRSRSKERPVRRSRSRERVRLIPEDDDSNLGRRDKKRNRRSRSRERVERDRERRRSRSRDRKRSKRSRSKERKFKIKEEEQQGQWVGGAEEEGVNGTQEFNDDGFPDSIRVKEEKVDAYAGYGGPGGERGPQQRMDEDEEYEEEEGEAQ
ncbi:unnamed protein product [Lymnaea stagnalis]|uniref:U1 small nuclear ribonucleoprotein 70 kDa n=1 Tax=Lymnaea stagnalis TaxID=6523 RepID=A0AAV2II18_LYMST